MDKIDDKVSSKKKATLTSLNVSPRGPRHSTFDDIFAMQSEHITSGSKSESEEDNIESKIEEHPTKNDSPDELLIQAFTRIKNKKKKGKTSRNHQGYYKSSIQKARTSFLYLDILISMIKTLVWNIKGIVNGPSTRRFKRILTTNKVNICDIF